MREVLVSPQKITRHVMHVVESASVSFSAKLICLVWSTDVCMVHRSALLKLAMVF